MSSARELMGINCPLASIRSNGQNRRKKLEIQSTFRLESIRNNQVDLKNGRKSHPPAETLGLLDTCDVCIG
jgi:hypothetical protein